MCSARDAEPLNPNFYYKVDQSYQYYVENWYTELDFACQPASAISFMFIWYFVGTLSSTIFSAMPDKYGRKKTVYFFLLASVIAQAILIYWPSYNAKCVAYFILGLGRLKDSQCYVWLSEFFPFRLKSTSYTIINIIDASPMSVTCFWLYFVNRDIKVINEIVFYIVIFALLTITILPDSPRWLIINNRRTDTIKSLNYLAKWNWSKKRIPRDAMFEE